MARIKGLGLLVFVIFGMASSCYGAADKTRPFSDLQNTLSVSTDASGKSLKAGEDSIQVTWGLSPGATSSDAYKTVKVKLCYAPKSQVDRPWRKTVLTNLAKDKTCQAVIFKKDFTATETTDTYPIKKEIPGATYFIRVYVYDSDGKEVAYGQTTDDKKETNHFTIVGISGRTASIDIASGVFSAFSVLSLVYFFYAEKKKGNRAEESG